MKSVKQGMGLFSLGSVPCFDGLRILAWQGQVKPELHIWLELMHLVWIMFSCRHWGFEAVRGILKGQ